MSPKTKDMARGTAGRKKRLSSAVKFILTVIKMLIIFFIALTCAILGIMGGAIYGYIKTASPITPEQLKLNNLTSFVYDSKDKEIAQLKGLKNRVRVEHKDIPDNLRNAFVAIEDKTFYKHSGIDFKRIGSATLSYILNAGDAKHGGSTITQQLVRNITGEKKKTLQRKVQEWWQAIQLERKLTKEEILDNYMNFIYMGNGCYGVQSASRIYFNKDVKELSLAECASLAGITNSPGLLSPTGEKGKERNKERCRIILTEMLKQNYITQKEYDLAASEELRFAEWDESKLKNTSKQSYFVDQVVNDVKKDLMDQYQISEAAALAALYNYGYSIYTTQDSEMQNTMDEIFQDIKYFPVNKKIADPQLQAQAAMVIIDPKDGEIKALYGGYGEKKGSFTLNRATEMERQAGSSFKPLAVYGPAIDTGLITPATVVDDTPVYLDHLNKDKMYPTNYESDKYIGMVDIHDAIRYSINVVAAKVYIMNPDLPFPYLRSEGINRDSERYISLALGGLNKGVNPLLMAAAYVPFANKGMYYKPITYTRVEDNNGRVILERKPEGNIVYKDERTAYIMTSMMMDVCKSGTASVNGYGLLQNGRMPTAGKTGTTSDFKDKWFVGYSPYYVAAAWYGYNTPTKLQKSEYNQALLLWHEVMERVHKKLKPIDFTEPSGLVRKAVCIYSGKAPSELCSRDPRGNSVREEIFIKGTEPKDNEKCDMHILAKVCKDHKDIYGRNLNAGPYCPPESVIEQVFILRKEPYMPVNPKDPYPLDMQYELPAGEYCNVHGAPPENTAGTANTTGNTSDSSAGTAPATGN